MDSPGLIVIEELDSLLDMLRNEGAAAVDGKFVKLAPRIPASQRERYDLAKYAADIRAAGALSVVLAPTFLSETKKEVETVAKAQTDRDACRAWFEAQTAADPNDLEAAEKLVLGFMDMEGM